QHSTARTAPRLAPEHVVAPTATVYLSRKGGTNHETQPPGTVERLGTDAGGTGSDAARGGPGEQPPPPTRAVLGRETLWALPGGPGCREPVARGGLPLPIG